MNVSFLHEEVVRSCHILLSQSTSSLATSYLYDYVKDHFSLTTINERVLNFNNIAQCAISISYISTGEEHYYIRFV
ncbi:hypothetical protein KUTeg_021756 [Tegillarca granosa]|uniref:Uncharacterized protein n=1 Tax=Tegillarca granosa TaxID=220873 RepID=A0ABQ9E9M0_TEGGR|nr:hypothetical protein KUTeg_021756 [Tegillarca granosa]